jgi:hypothetical protein
MQSKLAQLRDLKASLKAAGIACRLQEKHYGARLTFPFAGHCLRARQLAAELGFNDYETGRPVVPKRGCAKSTAEFSYATIATEAHR